MIEVSALAKLLEDVPANYQVLMVGESLLLFKPGEEGGLVGKITRKGEVLWKTRPTLEDFNVGWNAMRNRYLKRDDEKMTRHGQIVKRGVKSGHKD